MDHIAMNHIYTDMTKPSGQNSQTIPTNNTEDPQQKYRLETVSNRLLRGLNMFCWAQTSPSLLQWLYKII